MKKFLLALILMISVDAYAVTFTAIPCNVSGGLISNTGPHPDDNFLCDFQAAEVQLNVYRIALCTQAPTFSNNSEPDFNSCSIIYTSESPTEVNISASSGFNLANLTKPPPGTYSHILLLLQNRFKVKAQAHFDGLRASKNGGSGRYCWTNGSSITPMAQTETITGSGVTCGDSVNSGSYDFNEITWVSYGGMNGISEQVPGGINTDYFLDSNLRTDSTGLNTARWASINTPSSPIIVSDETVALRMSMNLSTGASLRFDTSDNNKIKWIEDAPFGYIFEPVNQ